MTDEGEFTPTEQLMMDRIWEHIEGAIAAEPDEDRRRLLREFVEEGDFGIQPSDRPDMVLVTVGDLDVGEVSRLSLRRPPDASAN